MRFTIVILTLLLCLKVQAESGVDQQSDDAVVAAAEQLIAESETTQPVNLANVPLAESSKLEIKESDIPVVMSSKAEAKPETSIVWRMIASVGVLILVAGGTLYATKRWAKPKDKGGRAARIEIMHQLHLGPRRSIALIRVSGETILIGVTDQSVNMLKAVTLIDDELEGAFAKDFNGFLEDDFSIQDVRSAIGSRA